MQHDSPYGKADYSWGSMPTSFTSAGERLDSQTGLLYDTFRYYDPLSGRFVRADNVQDNSTGMDPSAYVGDNPETRNDPSGHCFPLCFITAAVGAVVGAAVNVGVTVVSNAMQGKPTTLGEIAQSAVVGGITGAITGALGPEAGPLAKMAAGAVAGGLSQMAGNAMSGKPLMDGVVGATVAGAATAGLMEVGGTLLKNGAKAVSSALENAGECSFTSSTKVATSDGERSIGDLHVGELVLAYNPSTHKTELQPILHVWTHTDNDLVDLTLASLPTNIGGKTNRQRELLHTTSEHPFLTQEKGFLPAGQLVPGLHILKANGSRGVVVAVRVVHTTAVMYNLTVALDHTFAVGNGQWIVHNVCIFGALTGTYRGVASTLRNFGLSGDYQSHHIFQDAMMRVLPGYSYGDAPAIALLGGVNTPGSPHALATAMQDLWAQAFRTSGYATLTFADATAAAKSALQAAGYAAQDAQAIVDDAATYFTSNPAWGPYLNRLRVPQ